MICVPCAVGRLLSVILYPLISLSSRQHTFIEQLLFRRGTENKMVRSRDVSSGLIRSAPSVTLPGGFGAGKGKHTYGAIRV